MNPTLLVMAAGAASRYGGLKQTEPVGPAGETIVDYSIFDALRAGFGKVVFVIRRDIEPAFRTAIGDAVADRVEVHYAWQELDILPPGFLLPAERVKPWGTGHAVLVCEPFIAEPFAIVNADDFYGRSSFQLLADHLRGAHGASMDEHAVVGYELGRTLSGHGAVTRGRCEVDARGLLRQLIETKGIVDRSSGPAYENPPGVWHTLPRDTLVSMNMMGFTAGIFPQLRRLFTAFLERHGDTLDAEFLMPSAVNELVASGDAAVRVLRTDATWFGMTFREDRPIVQAGIRALVDRGEYPSPLWR
jgi:hypothetical protein